MIRKSLAILLFSLTTLSVYAQEKIHIFLMFMEQSGQNMNLNRKLTKDVLKSVMPV